MISSRDKPSISDDNWQKVIKPLQKRSLRVNRIANVRISPFSIVAEWHKGARSKQCPLWSIGPFVAHLGWDIVRGFRAGAWSDGQPCPWESKHRSACFMATGRQAGGCNSFCQGKYSVGNWFLMEFIGVLDWLSAISSAFRHRHSGWNWVRTFFGILLFKRSMYWFSYWISAISQDFTFSKILFCILRLFPLHSFI